MSTNSVLSFQDSFGTNRLDSSSELLFASLLANTLQTKGYTLSLEGCYVNLDSVSDSVKTFFDQMVGHGKIITNYSPSRVPLYTDYDVPFNLEIINVPEMLSETDKPGVYTFEYRQAYNRVYAKYRDLNPFKSNNLRHTFQYLFINHIANVLIGKADFVFHLDLTSRTSDNSYFYNNMVFWMDTYPLIKDYVSLEVADQAEFDYSKFIFKSYNYNRRRIYTLGEKRNILEQQGIQPGSILVFWDRNVKPNMLDGDITRRVLVRFNGYTEDNASVSLTTIPEPVTLEEKKIQFYAIPEEHRGYYLDLPKPPQPSAYITNTYPLRDLGIEGFMYDEPHFLTKLDLDEDVTKLVSLDETGRIEKINMSAVDAIFWALKQYGFDFDEDMFKSMYFQDGSEPLYNLTIAA